MAVGQLKKRFADDMLIRREQKCRKCGAGRGEKCHDRIRSWDEAVHNVRRVDARAGGLIV